MPGAGLGGGGQVRRPRGGRQKTGSPGSRPTFHLQLLKDMAVVQNRFGIPFWGDWCTTHLRAYFSGDGDVHGYGNLTHSQMGVAQNSS